MRDLLSREVKTSELLRALIVVGPMVAAYFISRETALLNLGLVAVSLLIPALRQHFPPKVVAWHYLAILVTFAALFLAAPVKPLFVVLTALAGFLAVAGTRYGEHFRTLGNWVFIPAVYLACEVREGVSAEEAIRHAGVIIASSPIALALVGAVQIYDQRQRGDAATSFGPPAADWFLPAAATAMAVFAAAALVEIFNLAQGQWVMWSAASVVVGDLTASTGKLKQRAIGAFVGAPFGFLAGPCPAAKPRRLRHRDSRRHPHPDLVLPLRRRLRPALLLHRARRILCRRRHRHRRGAHRQRADRRYVRPDCGSPDRDRLAAGDAEDPIARMTRTWASRGPVECANLSRLPPQPDAVGSAKIRRESCPQNSIAATSSLPVPVHSRCPSSRAAPRRKAHRKAIGRRGRSA
ncbi:FUSC family protein [Bradyrhizobium japonicum]|uniref:FUSC family protein n=1 Tax=Bradyrhizobium japonicum TaxID=375 RepID=UPI00384CCC20